jgi:hypothetical protein
MREIRLYGSEGGGAGCSPYPYQFLLSGRIPTFAGMTTQEERLVAQSRSSIPMLQSPPATGRTR